MVPENVVFGFLASTNPYRRKNIFFGKWPESVEDEAEFLKQQWRWMGG